MLKHLLVLLLLVVYTVNANSADFLGKSFSATYVKEEEGLTGIKKSTGVIQFQSPNKFIIKQIKPFESTLLSDGRKSWYINPAFDPSEPPEIQEIDDKSNPLPHIFSGIRNGIRDNKVFSVAASKQQHILTFQEKYKKVLELESVVIDFKSGSKKNHFRDISYLTVMKKDDKKIEYKITKFDETPNFGNDHFQLKIKP